MNKKKYPKILIDFFKNKSQYEQFSPLVVPPYEEFLDPEFSDDTLIPVDVYDPDNDEKNELVDLLGFTENEDYKNFKENFVPIIQEPYDSFFPVHILGIFLNEEEEGLPIYYLSEATEGRPEKVCESLESFIQLYLSKGENNPLESLKALEQTVPQLYESKNFEKIKEKLDIFFDKHASYIADLEPMKVHNYDLEARLGFFYNYVGLLHLESKEIQKASDAFELSYLYGDISGFLNMLETLCYKLKDYEQAQKFSRKYVKGVDKTDPYYTKVKIDGYASIHLGDEKSAKTAYKLLYNKFLNIDNNKIQMAQKELQKLDIDLAKEILEWFYLTEIKPKES